MAPIDQGIRAAVEALNRIAGVETRASCEGSGRECPTHGHATLAYVLLRHPMPLRLQDFLLKRLAEVARIDDASIYSRWPARNRAFVNRLTRAAHSFRGRQANVRHLSLRLPLARLRARLARELAEGTDRHLGFCAACRELVVEPHPGSHPHFPVIRLPAHQQVDWFTEFAARPGNSLDGALVAADGWRQLEERARRGDFGTIFRRRWLIYRGRMTANLATQGLRQGIAVARHKGRDVDFCYDRTHATLSWDPALVADRAGTRLGR